jgi:3-isopropylmalate/(R)-2-methylmalate dehydratase small subunit
MPRVILKLGDDVSTDVIYPGRYMATVLPSETPAHAFADHAAFQAALKARAVPPGSVVAAGRNFGCGSSREQAASCLKGHELAVVARSFARIFLQNAINLGLNVVLAPSFEANEGDEIVFEEGLILDLTSGRAFPIDPLPKARQAILDAGGLVPYTRARLTAGAVPR